MPEVYFHMALFSSKHPTPISKRTHPKMTVMLVTTLETDRVEKFFAGFVASVVVTKYIYNFQIPSGR
jgi:hypothetical protein